MGDPYWGFGAASTDRGSFPRPSFPGYLTAEPSALTSHNPWSSNALQASSSDYVNKEMLPLRTGAYGVDDIRGMSVHPDIRGISVHPDIRGISVHPEPRLGGLTPEASIKGYPAPLQDPSLLSQRPDVAVGIGSGVPDLINERPASLSKVDGLPVPVRESNILFVDGLPSDCSRREVGHLFRPFIGFKDIRLVHKEPRRSGDKAMVLCFVEFNDAKCALTAMEALQGYKFDDKKPESPVLKIHFAHFPFRLPSDHGEQWLGGPR